MVRRLCVMALQGYIDDFAVFGSDFPTPDGTAIRDYVHVTDLADAHVRALQNLLDGSEGGTFNLGAGKGYSVRQVLDAISIETKKSLLIPNGGRRDGDAAELFADITKAREKLGWNPKSSDLTTIIRSAWRWHQKAHTAR